MFEIENEMAGMIYVLPDETAFEISKYGIRVVSVGELTFGVKLDGLTPEMIKAYGSNAKSIKLNLTKKYEKLKE